MYLIVSRHGLITEACCQTNQPNKIVLMGLVLASG